MKPNILVFDVESTSLHGTGFAVGAIVRAKNHKLIDQFELRSLEGSAKANDWCKENVLPHLGLMPTCETDRELRDAFFDFYMKHKDTADVWADVIFPVETNFLSAIVADSPSEREWVMPYPLKDISVEVSVRIDRVRYSGLSNLTPHNPLHDAMASMECMPIFR